MVNAAGKERIVHTICNNCAQACGLEIHVAGDRITRVNPIEGHVVRNTSGCPRAAPEALMEMMHSDKRLRKPLRRVNGDLRETSWEDALDFISEKLQLLKEKHGAKALTYQTGNAFLATESEKVVRRFCDLYGTPNFSSVGSLCFYARRFAHAVTLNHTAPIYAFPNWEGSSASIVWGVNPHESERVVLPEISAMKAKGGKLIVIDPRQIPLAKEADIYTVIRPGTDGALALGLLNVIIEEQLYDEDFVENWTVGFEQLAQHIKQYPPDSVAEITWVPADTIRAIARTYAQSKPANIYQGVAADHSINGFQAHRAIVILMTITGNIDAPGGQVWTPKAPPFTNLRLPDKVSLDEGIGSEFPIFNRFSLERQAMCVPDSILNETPYAIKAMIAHGTEPMREWPNTKKVEAALRKLELLVVIDLFLTDTAKMADVVLPAASFLEKQLLKDYGYRGIPLTALSEPVAVPVGDAMPDWKIVAELGRRMGFEEHFPWKEIEGLAQYLLDPTGITVEQLKENPKGVFYAEWEPRGYLREGFNTSSGKAELYSDLLKQYGYDPLPEFVEPAESPISRQDLARTYPLILVTGPKTRFYTHSRFRDLTFLRRSVPEATVEINSETARGLGIGQGDMVTVESPRGKIGLRAAVTEDIHPRVVSVQHGWGGNANVNLLMDDTPRDPVSGYPSLKASLCKVYG